MLINDYLTFNIIICIRIYFEMIYFREVGQKYRHIFVCFLVQMKTSKSHSEINWPLVVCLFLQKSPHIFHIHKAFLHHELLWCEFSSCNFSQLWIHNNHNSAIFYWTLILLMLLQGVSEQSVQSNIALVGI